MKNKLAGLLLLFLFAFEASSQENEVTVQLRENYTLKGEMLQLTPNELHLRHQSSQAKMIIPVEQILFLSVVFTGNEIADYSMFHPYQNRIHFNQRTNNTIPCKLLAIDSNNVSFATPFSSNTTISKKYVRSITFNASSYSPLWSPPVIFDEQWSSAQHPVSPQLLKSLKPSRKGDGFLYHFPKSKEVYLEKQLGLDINSFNFSTEVRLPDNKPESEQDLTFQFFSTKAAGDSFTFSILLTFKNNQWSLAISEKADLSDLKAITNVNVTNPNQTMLLELLVYQANNSKNTLRYHLLVNGNEVDGEMQKQSDGLYLPGSFRITSNGAATVELSNPLLSNYANLDESIPRSNSSTDTIKTIEEEIIPITIKEYQTGKKSIISVTNDQSDAVIPEKYIMNIFFNKDSKNAIAESDPAAESYSLTLKDSSSLSGQVNGFKNQRLLFTHPLMGKMSIPIAFIEQITPLIKKPLAKSTP